MEDKYVNKMNPFADYMNANNPHEIEYFDNPISEEVFGLISEYQDKLQKIAEDYDLDNQEINQTVTEVNTFIDKCSDTKGDIMKGLKIDKDNMLDTDGVEYEDYSATFKGKEVVARVSIERKDRGEVDIKRYWNDIQIIEEVTS